MDSRLFRTVGFSQLVDIQPIVTPKKAPAMQSESQWKLTTTTAIHAKAAHAALRMRQRGNKIATVVAKALDPIAVPDGNDVQPYVPCKNRNPYMCCRR